MYQAGVNIALGTDMGYDPEMGTNARELEGDGGLGTVEAGKFADLIAVDGDPLKNIRCLQEKKNIKVVMKEGKIHADRRPGRSKNVVNVKPGDWKIIDY